MRERGYVEGQNLSIDVRWPQGTFEHDPSPVAELINSNVDVIVAWATPAVNAARRATSAIPIVMVGVGDPVASGFIASLAQPGGNITGLSNITVDLSAKLVELFAELVPGMKRVGVSQPPAPGSHTTGNRPIFRSVFRPKCDDDVGRFGFVRLQAIRIGVAPVGEIHNLSRLSTSSSSLGGLYDVESLAVEEESMLPKQPVQLRNHWIVVRNCLALELG
jgi:putative ABC transport system substrate-binding protein